jgi:hypothetical protein
MEEEEVMELDLQSTVQQATATTVELAFLLTRDS